MKLWWSMCVLSAVLVAGATGACARTVAGIEMPPAWPAGNASDTHWGTTVPDPYRDLENVKDEPVQRWLRAQADASASVLAQLPGRAALLARIQALDAAANGVATDLKRTQDGRLFFLRRNPGEQQLRLVVRESLGADGASDRVLVDADALSRAAGRPVAISDYAPSPDGKLVSYALQAGGSEIGTLQVLEVDSGRVRVAPIDRMRSANVVWLPDSSGFFYARLREGYEAMAATERFQDRTVFFHSMPDASDRAVFSQSLLPELGLPAIASATLIPVPGRPLVLAWVTLGVQRSGLLFIADLDAAKTGRARWRKLVDVADQVSQWALNANALFLRSAQGAPRFQVLKLSLDEPDLTKAEVVVPQSDAVITGLAGARDALYVTRREGVVTSLWRLAPGASRALRVDLPRSGTVAIRHVDSTQDGVIVRVASWTRAGADFEWNAGSGKATPLTLAHVGAFDAPPGIQAREVTVRSHDGVMVPVSILSRTDVKLDGSNPTLLYGYGAYGLVESPGFSATLLAWLEQGGIYAIAHVRGGGVYGDAWHKAGHKTTKANTWKDGIAVAEWLIAEGYTSRSKLGVFGGSAGGIFVGRAITERPDLFAAAVPSVPVLDTVRSELRANGVANVPEYGTVKKEDEFRGLLAMSSYHALIDGTRYPAVMLTHGVNDIRVDVWQSAKFAARLAATGAGVEGAKPVLLRLDYESGHGGGSSRAQVQERQADVWAFMLWQMGVAGFQPKSPSP